MSRIETVKCNLCGAESLIPKIPNHTPWARYSFTFFGRGEEERPIEGDACRRCFEKVQNVMLAIKKETMGRGEPNVAA